MVQFENALHKFTMLNCAQYQKGMNFDKQFTRKVTTNKKINNKKNIVSKASTMNVLV